jgi:K+-transporting ATPase ATPase A chain
VLLCVRPLGTYMADVLEGRSCRALRIGGRCERWLYRSCGVQADREMSWSQYAIALLAFNALGVLVLYSLQRL